MSQAWTPGRDSQRKPPRRWLWILILLLVVIVGALLLWFLVFNDNDDAETNAPPTFTSAQEAADTGLATLRELAGTENITGLGATAAEFERATLGQPMPVFRIDLDRLLAFNPDQDPLQLLTDVSRQIFPVVVDQQVKSSVVVEAPDGRTWRATGYGEATLVQALSKVRPQGDSLVVQIPALGLYFQGTRSENGLALTPILDDPRFDFATGRTQDAKAVLARILPAAKEYNGLPIG